MLKENFLIKLILYLIIIYKALKIYLFIFVLNDVAFSLLKVD